jgi:hypothetical protein
MPVPPPKLFTKYAAAGVVCRRLGDLPGKGRTKTAAEPTAATATVNGPRIACIH